MARKKKSENFTLEEKLAALVNEITTTEDRLREMRQQRKELEKQIEDKKKDEIYRIIVESGRSLDEVMEMLKAGN